MASYYFLCLYVAFFVNKIKAQHLPVKDSTFLGTVTGKVIDEKRQPVEVATVSIFNNGTIVGCKRTDTNGEFSIPNIYCRNNCQLRVNYIGYQIVDSTISIQENKYLTIQLTQELRKPRVITHIKPRIINIENAGRQIIDKTKLKQMGY